MPLLRKNNMTSISVVDSDFRARSTHDFPLRGLPCQRHDPDLWFADEPAGLERAKQLCGGCPIQAACLTGAIRRSESAGVWGGQIFDNGKIIAHKRPRGRPRKDPPSVPSIAVPVLDCVVVRSAPDRRRSR
jgi:WhiB family redox-sensing transcriptional regulator